MDTIKIKPSNPRHENYHYFIGKSSILLHNLLTGKGNAKERLLENAYWLHKLLAMKLPQKVTSKQEKLLVKITAKDPIIYDNVIYTNGVIRTLRDIRKTAAAKIIEEFNSIFHEVKDYQEYINEKQVKQKKDKIKITVQYSPKP